METNSEAFVKPPIDLDKPVKNPALVAAIAAVSQTQTEITKRDLLYQLNHANYLVALNNDELNVMSQSVAGQAKINGLMKVLSCSDSDGLQLLPVFTDWDEIEAFSSQKLATLVMPSRQLWRFALDGSYEGIIVNPAQISVVLGMDQVEELQRLSTELVVSAQVDIDAYAGRSRRVRSYHRILSIVLIIVSGYFYRGSATGPCVAFGVLAITSMVLEFIPLGRKRSKPAA